MFERFTDESVAVLAASRHRAHELGHDHLGTEHLLLGILSGDSARARPTLESFGVTLAQARAQTRAIVTPPAGDPPAHLELTATAMRAIEWARLESMRRPWGLIGADDLLLGLIKANGTGVAVLVGLEVDIRQLHDALRDVTAAGSPTPGAFGPLLLGTPNIFIDMLEATDEVTNVAIEALVAARRADAAAEDDLEAILGRLAALLAEVGAEDLLERIREIVAIDPNTGGVTLRRR